MSVAWYQVVIFVYFVLGFIIIFGVRKDSKKKGEDYKMNLLEWLLYLVVYPGMVIGGIIAMILGWDPAK